MVANVQRSPHTGTHSAGSQNCNLQFAVAFLPFAFTPPSPLLGWSTSKLWQQVSDAVCSAVMSDVRLTQFACLAVVLGLFLLWWRK